MESKLVIVGYGPSHRGSPERPLDGPGTGYRLAKLFGLEYERYLEIERVNLFYETPRDYRMDLSCYLAYKIRQRYYKGERLVLLGKNVARAFGVSGEFTWIRDGYLHLVAIPHPSGLNRWYNDKMNVRRCEQFLRSLL